MIFDNPPHGKLGFVGSMVDLWRLLWRCVASSGVVLCRVVVVCRFGRGADSRHSRGRLEGLSR